MEHSKQLPIATFADEMAVSYITCKSCNHCGDVIVSAGNETRFDNGHCLSDDISAPVSKDLKDDKRLTVDTTA